MLVQSLKWPVVVLLLIGGSHFVEEAVQPKLVGVFTPSVVAPVVFAVGLWLGYRVAMNGGNFLTGILAGAILGLLPVMLEIVGFGILLGRGIEAGVLGALFGFSLVLWGSMIGSGFGATRAASGI